MNHAMLQRIVEEVAARLRHRALSTATLSVAQLNRITGPGPATTIEV